MTLFDWQQRIAAWSLATFGPGQRLGPCLKHLRRELDEVASAPPEARGEELADVLILLLALSDRLGVDLEAELGRKHRINQARQWGKPDHDGLIEHVREG